MPCPAPCGLAYPGNRVCGPSTPCCLLMKNQMRTAKKTHKIMQRRKKCVQVRMHRSRTRRSAIGDGHGFPWHIQAHADNAGLRAGSAGRILFSSVLAVVRRILTSSLDPARSCRRRRAKPTAEARDTRAPPGLACEACHGVSRVGRKPNDGGAAARLAPKKSGS